LSLPTVGEGEVDRAAGLGANVRRAKHETVRGDDHPASGPASDADGDNRRRNAPDQSLDVLFHDFEIFEGTW
jgi:hypothetical protein